MSKIKDLIQQHCPNGVEYKKLGEVCTYTRGVTYNKTKEINDGGNGWKVLRANNITLGNNTLNFDDVKIISKDVNVRDTQKLYKDDILICAGSGSKEHIGKVAFIDADIDYTFGGFMGVVRAINNSLNSRFLFHLLTGEAFKEYLSMNLMSSTINNLNITLMNNFLIPIPPLVVQEEIVRILDIFSALTAELEAELEARKKQYQYYRDKLLSFDNLNGEYKQVIYKTLGECVQVINAPYKMNKKFYLAEGKYPIIDQGQKYIIAYTNDATGLLPLDDYVIFGEHTKEIKYVDFQFIQGADGLKILKNKDFILPKYLYHCMQNLKIPNRGYNRHWTVTAPLKIPIPSIEEQERIVKILDKFERLVNDISEGIPAEIKARRQQYEYYRDMLLNFKKLEK